ncbi:hypothetical protein Hanom_Chr04g00334931 [Helianthus anomalus]
MRCQSVIRRTTLLQQHPYFSDWLPPSIAHHNHSLPSSHRPPNTPSIFRVNGCHHQMVVACGGATQRNEIERET